MFPSGCALYSAKGTLSLTRNALRTDVSLLGTCWMLMYIIILASLSFKIISVHMIRANQ